MSMSLAVLTGAALLGGLVRGFTGFGFAMVFVPLAMIVVGPAAAVGMVWTVDLPYALPLAVRAARRAAWREVAPLLVGATAFLPLGAWLLTRLDPLVTRWLIAIAVLLALAALVSGWRYAGRPSVALSLGVGGISGVASGLAALSGMPLAVFWLGSQDSDAAQVRANLMAFFGVSSVVSGVVFAAAGVLTVELVTRALLLVLPYGAGVWLGSWAFGRASEAMFRLIAYLIIATAAVLAVPALDPWLR
jgi:uncharacterized membrane protein YfcA